MLRSQRSTFNSSLTEDKHFKKSRGNVQLNPGMFPFGGLYKFLPPLDMNLEDWNSTTRDILLSIFWIT